MFPSYHIGFNVYDYTWIFQNFLLFLPFDSISPLKLLHLEEFALFSNYCYFIWSAKKEEKESEQFIRAHGVSHDSWQVNIHSGDKNDLKDVH